jgi:hypothetical protein
MQTVLPGSPDVPWTKASSSIDLPDKSLTVGLIAVLPGFPLFPFFLSLLFVDLFYMILLL